MISLAVEINRAHAGVQRCVAQGLEHARRAGELLAEAKAALPHGDWLPWLAEHCDMPERTAQAYLRVAAHWPTLEAKAQRVADLPLRQALALLAEPPSPAEADAAVSSKAHVSRATGQFEWYTPVEYIETARRVLGTIDLDPASSPEANTIVGATRFFTAVDDGLAQPWTGRVWMNPPYAQPIICHFASKLAQERKLAHVTAAIVLVNNATETRWFRTLADVAAAICFPTGRVTFWSPDGEVGSQPLQGQAVLYFGEHAARFGAAFRAFGFVLLTQQEPLE